MRRALSWRSALIGLGGVILLCAVTPWNDYHLHQTYLYGNHFPVGCLFLFILIVLVLNTLLRRFAPRSALAQAELLTIWAMFITGSGFASSGLMRYLGPLPVAPYYYASESNRWTVWAKAIPAWMVPSTDPHSPTVKWFFEGLPPGGAVPWQPWVHVFFAWGVLVALVVGFSLFVCSLARKQWVDRERLVFPLVFIPIEITKDPQAGTVNAFFRSRLMWLGVCVSFGVHLVNGLHHYWFSIPAVPISWQTYQLWPNQPWSSLYIDGVSVYFSAIGLSFLLPSDVSLSIWSFFLLFRLLRVFEASMGIEPTWLSMGVPSNEAGYTMGGFLVWAAWLLWVARDHCRTVLRSLVAPSSAKKADEPIPPRVSLIGAVICFLGIVAWTRAAGASLALAFMLWGIFAVILLVLTRIVAESGLLMVQTPFLPTDAMNTIHGSSVFNYSGMGSAMMIQTVWMSDPRESYMPSMMNALRLKGEGTGRGLIKAVLLATAVGFVVSYVSFIYVSYRYGGVNLDAWGHYWCPITYYGKVIRWIDAPIKTDWSVVANTGVGGVISALLLVMRKNYLWWGLHPIGFVMAPTYAVKCCWFSILIAWLCKRLALLGGYRTYRSLIPLFLGMVLGDALAAGVWMIVGMFTGVGVWYFLPS